MVRVAHAPMVHLVLSLDNACVWDLRAENVNEARIS
jgi:hypothetical protein